MLNILAGRIIKCVDKVTLIWGYIKIYILPITSLFLLLLPLLTGQNFYFKTGLFFFFFNIQINQFTICKCSCKKTFIYKKKKNALSFIKRLSQPSHFFFFTHVKDAVGGMVVIARKELNLTFNDIYYTFVQPTGIYCHWIIAECNMRFTKEQVTLHFTLISHM